MLPSGLLSAIGFFPNVAMIISIYKKNGTKLSHDLILQWIGSINALTALPMAVFMIARSLIIKGFMIEKAAVIGFLTSLLLLQLYVNLTLTYDRYLAVKKPLQYRLASRLTQSKRWLIIGIVPILAISGVIAYLLTVLPSLKIHLILLGSARAVTFASMSIIYYKLLKEYRKSNANIESSSGGSELQTAASRIRRINERHMTYKCLVITISFFILNLPVAVASNLLPNGGDCGTKQGIVLSVFVALDSLNRVIDPIWYFLMERRKRSQIQKVQQSQIAFIQLQSENNVKIST